LSRKPACLDHAPVFRDWKLPPIFEQLRSELESRHGALAGSRQFVRVLQLLASQSVERIAAVIELTLARDGPQVDLLLSRVEHQRSVLREGLPADHTWFGLPAVHVPRPDLSRFDQFLSRTGAELLFQVFADRYERASLLVTSNLPFSEWHQIFQGERMTAALLDRLTHRCHIFEMNGESYRFRESMKAKGKKTTSASASTK
jgi:hypothetical protein